MCFVDSVKMFHRTELARLMLFLSSLVGSLMDKLNEGDVQLSHKHAINISSPDLI